MSSEFDMSMMGELTFFLGLHIKQSSQGTSIFQEKYIKELFNKFKMLDVKVLDMPMITSARIDKDKAGKEVNQSMYRGIIGSLLYLTSRIPYNSVQCGDVC